MKKVTNNKKQKKQAEEKFSSPKKVSLQFLPIATYK